MSINRRQFLGLGGAAVTAAAFAPGLRLIELAQARSPEAAATEDWGVSFLASVGPGAQQANATRTPPTPARSTPLVHGFFGNGIVMIPILRFRVW